MAVPVFVLGLQRSGTTWVANMLAGSGAVAAVAAPEHQGVHESIFFSHFARLFGPFDDPQARGRFLDAFAASDYFLLTGLPRASLDAMVAQATDPAGVFAAVMDAVADRDGCTHWLEKSPHHTLLADDLAMRFPEARFVCVMRASATLVASRLVGYGRSPSRGLKRAADILRGALVNALYARHMRRFAARAQGRALLLRYEELTAHPASGQRRLVRFLGLAVPPERLVSAYSPNTSHKQSGTQRLSPLDRALVWLGDGLGRLVPLAVLALAEDRRRRARGADWPDWVWLKTGYRPR